MRVIALDVHRSFAELAIHKDGLVRSAGRIMLEHGYGQHRCDCSANRAARDFSA